MQRSSQLPEFGKWDDGEDVPYTTYFDNATKARPKRSNPNDPSFYQKEIPDTVNSNYGRDYDSVKSAKSQQALKSKHTQEDLSLEDGNMRKYSDSPLHHHQRQGNNMTSNSSKITTRNGEGSDRSRDYSPLQRRPRPRTEAKTAVPSSPLQERRGASSPRGVSHDGIAPLTPGRSRQRSVPRGNESVISFSHFLSYMCFV